MTNPSAAENTAKLARPQRLAWAWTAVGYAFFGLGLVGTVLPVMPTTIFWIIAAGCFAKGCPAMTRRIYAWPGIGPAVQDFLDHGVITRKAKVSALIGMAVGAVVVLLTPLSLSATLMTVAVIGLAALYVATRPERRPDGTVALDG